MSDGAHLNSPKRRAHHYALKNQCPPRTSKDLRAMIAYAWMAGYRSAARTRRRNARVSAAP